MARRTAEMHVALAAGADDPAFAPEPFTPMYQRSLYQSMREQLRLTLARLRRRLPVLPEALREPAERILRGEETLLRQARRVLDRIDAVRIRCHGDYHLRHLVSIGRDFVIVDFEGEADRPLSHRRRKRSPIRDLTSLHRSLQEAAQAALAQGGFAPRTRRSCGRGRCSGSGGRRWCFCASTGPRRGRRRCCRKTRPSSGSCSTFTVWDGTCSGCAANWIRRRTPWARRSTPSSSCSSGQSKRPTGPVAERARRH